MNVLLLTPAYRGHPGGVQTHSRHLAEHLPEISAVSRLDVIEFHPAFTPANRLIQRVRTAWCYFLVTRSKFDLCWVTHVDLSPLARLIQILGGPPYIISCHGIDVWGPLPLHKKWGLSGARSLVAVSRHTRTQLITEREVHQKKILLLPNTFDAPAQLPEVRAASSWLRERWNLPEGFIFLYLGRLRPQDRDKGYGLVLRTVQRLNRAGIACSFIAAGEGPDRDWLRSQAESLGVAQHLVCPGRVPDNELSNYFRGADLFTMPSTKEGFGITFLESLAHGTPPLGGIHDGSRDPLGEGRMGLLCDPTDPDNTFHTLHRFLTDETHPLKDQSKLIKSVHESFGYEIFRDRLRNTLKEIGPAL
ncbi:MAG: glycosyltransferase family 4 protein [Verrucomicrobiota bacterium]